MSLPRKDVRFKVYEDVHRCLLMLADIDNVEVCQWVELVIEKEIKQRIHAASMLASRAQEVGLAAKPRESRG
jgi:hypothetical protein